VILSISGVEPSGSDVTVLRPGYTDTLNSFQSLWTVEFASFVLAICFHSLWAREAYARSTDVQSVPLVELCLHCRLV
jgi:hypothetical protein